MGNHLNKSTVPSDVPDGITIVWLDRHALSNSDQQSQLISSILRNMHSSVLFYNNVDTCLHFLRHRTHAAARIFLIVSGQFSKQILNSLPKLSIIDSIFIFCMHPDRYSALLQQYAPHIIGIYDDVQRLRDALIRELGHYQSRVRTLNFFAQNQNTTRDLTYDAASFLWFQIIRQVLIESHYSESDKTEMLQYCRDRYARDPNRKKRFADIAEFERTYQPDQAIEWYTRQTFIYQLINAALRTEDIDALHFFRYYISDLCRALANQPRKELLKDRFIVYRGCRMYPEELRKLEEMQNRAGSQISMNGFISTSIDRKVAEKFLSTRPRSTMLPVLWTIHVDPTMDGIIFADISDQSAFPREKEVLFNIGTTFAIDKVQLDPTTKVWHIEATVTQGGIQTVRDYLTLVRQELHQTNIEVILGILLIDMGKYVTARNYFTNLIERSTSADRADLAVFHYNLGLTQTFERDLGLAERSFLQAIDYLKEVPIKSANLVRSYNALGHLYQMDGELRKAMECYREAERIGQSRLDGTELANAQTYSYMAQNFLIRGMYAEAKAHYHRALTILQTHLPANHHRIGIVFNHLANVSRREGHLKEAFDFYNAAASIFLETLPQYHPCTAYCWSGMGIAFLQTNDLNEARRYHAKALEIYRRVLPSNHLNLHLSEKNLHCQRFEEILDSYVEVCSQV